MKLDCQVIGDLLPLYHDGVCSAGSKALVEEHLSGCPQCKAALRDMDNEIQVDHGDEKKPLESIRRKVRRGKRRAWLGGVSTVLAVLLVAALAAGCWYGWWYANERNFYQQFADRAGSENITPVDLERETTYYIAPIGEDAEGCAPYQYTVVVPKYPWEQGQVVVTQNMDMNYTVSASPQEMEAMHALTLVISPDGDGYRYSLSVRNWDLTEFYVFELNSEMELILSEEWDDATTAYYEQALEEHRAGVVGIITAAKDVWTFLEE